MQIHFTGRNLEVTPAIKSYTTEKFEKLERRADIQHMKVTFHLEKTNHIAEATFQFNGHNVHAEATASNLYAAIDDLIDKLLAQVTKLKEKSSHH